MASEGRVATAVAGGRVGLGACALALLSLAGAAPTHANGLDDGFEDAFDDGVRVEAATDLAADASLAARQGAVILLEFAAADCPYCALLEEEFLKPMLRSGDYDGRVIMRVIDVDRAIPLTDFEGDRSTMAALADRFGVELTPTLVLVDSRGKPLVKRIVGIWSLDFFGGLLDERIASALIKARNAGRAGVPRGGAGNARAAAWERESR